MVQSQESLQCRDVKGRLLNLTNSATLRFPPDLLAAETLYEFNLDVSKGSRVTSDSTYVQIARGSFIDDAKLILASQQRVDSNQKISVVCESTTEITSFSYRIFEIGVSLPLSFVNLDASGRSLLLSPGTLSPGRSYTIQAVLTAFNRQPTPLSLTIAVNSPPSSGRCSVTPDSGIAGMTPFFVRCSGWVDVDDPITYSVVVPGAEYALEVGKPMSFTTATNASTLNFHVKISDSFQCSTLFPLSLVLYLPELVSPKEVGNSCKSFQKLGKYLEFLQCMDNQVAAQRSASAARDEKGSKRRLLAEESVELKSSAIQKIAVTANEAPFGVASLARSFVQSIAPLCSGGDLGQQPSSLLSCVDILSRSSKTLLQQPYSSVSSSGMISVATGALVSIVSNATNISTSTKSVQTIQEVLNITSAVVFHAVKQSLVGDAPLSFTTPFSSHLASRSSLASFESKIPTAAGMATYTLPANFSRMLDSNSQSTGPASAIVESYSSSARWSGSNLTFVSKIHGLSFFNDVGPLIVRNLQQKSAIKIEIPLEKDTKLQQVSVGSTLSSYKCLYWNVALQSWKMDGCSLASVNSTHATVMTTHLTQFSIIYDPPSSSPTSSQAPSAAATSAPATTAPTSTAAPIATTAPSAPQPTSSPSAVSATMSPTFARASLSVNVTFQTSIANFHSKSACIVSHQGASVSALTTFVSPTQMLCLVAASANGRTVNISVFGIVNITRSFVQFGDVKFVSVVWDATLSSVSILSSSILPVLSSGPSVACTQLFSPSSVSLFGVSPLCSMSGNTINVTVGSKSALMFQALEIQPVDRLFSLTDVPSEIYNTVLPNVTVPNSVPHPSASVQGATSLGSCSPISLQLLVPSPSFVSRPPQFAPLTAWSVASVAAAHNSSAATAALANRLANISSPSFVFLHNSWGPFGLSAGLPPGVYVILYSVTTWYQRRVSGSITVQIAPQDLPVISGIQIPTVIRRNAVAEFSAAIELSTCSANMALSYTWRIRNTALTTLVFVSFEKRLIVPRYTLAMQTSLTVSLTLNGGVNASSVIFVERLPPVAIISGGSSVRIGSSGGRISAAQSHDPNFAPHQQPQMTFSWSCSGVDLILPSTSENYLVLPPGLTASMLCSVTVTSGSLSSTADVTVIPVEGSPPSLVIAASASRVSLSQSLVLSVAIASGNANQYSYLWTASRRPLLESDAITSLQSASLAVKPGFLTASQSSADFKCRVTHVSTGVFAEAVVTVNLNPAPDCSRVTTAIRLLDETCVVTSGSTCSITAMSTKLRVSLTDDIGAVSGCIDDDRPIDYRLLAFRGPCTGTATGQLLATSVSPSFSGITLASGVKALAFEAVDSFGAVSRVCSSEFSVIDASAADLSSLIGSSSFIASLAGDRQGQQRFAANIAASLSSLYSSNADSASLDSIKESAFYFLNSSTSVITDPSTASQSAFTLFSLVSLPGPISPASSAAALNMFESIASSSLAMLSSGAASRDLAVEVSPVLVGGCSSLLKSVSASTGRRLLGYKTGMEGALSALLNAAKVQVVALAASQSAVIQDMSPTGVVGIRRLSSSSVSSLVVPSSSSAAVSVSVAPDADANVVRDVGVSVVVLRGSPFTTTIATTLLSPAVNVALFDASSGATLSQERSEVAVVFPVAQALHDSLVVEKSDGSRMSEQCVVYDGSKWTRSCTVTPFTSASATVGCMCNATQQPFAVALAQFSLDCKGVVGGLAVLDACKVCGGGIIDASLCSALPSSSIFPLPIWAAIAIAVGAAVLIAVSIFIVKVRRQRLLNRTKPVTAIDILTKEGATGSVAASFATEFAPHEIPAIPAQPARARIRPTLRTSAVDLPAASLPPRPSLSPNVSPRFHVPPPPGSPRAVPAFPTMPRPSRRVNVPDSFSSGEDLSPQRREGAIYQAPPPVVAVISENGDAFSASSHASRYVKLLSARLRAAAGSSSSPPVVAAQADSGARVGGASISPSRIREAPSYDGVPVRVVASSSGSNASRYAQMLSQRALRIQELRQQAGPQGATPAGAGAPLPENSLSPTFEVRPFSSAVPFAVFAYTRRVSSYSFHQFLRPSPPRVRLGSPPRVPIASAPWLASSAAATRSANGLSAVSPTFARDPSETLQRSRALLAALSRAQARDSAATQRPSTSPAAPAALRRSLPSPDTPEPPVT
jgi:hypothetical protein